MSFKQKYLFWFANENLNFRYQEIKSVLQIVNANLKWVSKLDEIPFWVAELNSDEDAFKIASRSVTLRSILRLWGSGNTLDSLHKDLKSYPQGMMESHLQSHLSFSVQVKTFNKTISMKEKIDKIELFNYLPVHGPVKLKNPDVRLYYIEYYGIGMKSILPSHLYFGMWLCDGQRELINKYSLKNRKFIGNTTMDPQLAFLMANQALIKPGDLVMDPFVGSGSLLVAAGNFGAYVLGTDIDYLMLHGKTRPTRIQARNQPRAKDENIYENMKQYGIESQYIDVVNGDSSLPFWHSNLQLDSIITDPPYGIREATEKIGSRKNYKISGEHLKTHVPSKVKYELNEIYEDLLNFAAKHLKLRGRLVSWIPVFKEDYKESNLPSHPCLTLISNCEQSLTCHTSRRLLTWEKFREVQLDSDCPNVPDMYPQGFRQHYFSRGETRKQRRARLAEEAKDNKR